MRSQTGDWEREIFSLRLRGGLAMNPFAYASGSPGITPLTLSPCHFVTLSPCHLITLSSNVDRE